MPTINQLVVAYPPLRDAIGAVFMDGTTKQVPTEAFAVPLVQSTAPIEVADYQTWIDTSTTVPTLRMFINGAWAGLFEIDAPAPSGGSDVTDATLTINGPITLPGDPTSPNHAANKHYVDNLAAPAGRVVVKGAIDCSTNPNYPDANQGDIYYVSVAGKIGGASGLSVATDVVLICKTNGTVSGPQGTAGASWTVLGSIAEVLALIAGQALAGDVTGTPGATAVSKIAGVALSADVLGQGQGHVYDTISNSLKARTSEGQNLLVNSAGDIWQENTTYTLGSSAPKVHVADFWKAAAAGTAQKTLSRVAGISNSRYAFKIARNPGSTDANRVRFAQQFTTEESMYLAGKTVTASFDILLGANYSATSAPSIIVYYGTGDSEDLDLHAGSPNFTTGGGNATSASIATQLPAIGTVGRVISSAMSIPAGVTEVAFAIATATFGASAAGADDSITFACLDCGIGSVATRYRKTDAGDEFQRCQRRFQKSFLLGTAPAQNVGVLSGEMLFRRFGAGAVNEGVYVPLKRNMRTAPTVTLYNPSAANGHVRNETGSADCSAETIDNISESGFRVAALGNSGGSAGDWLGFHWVADSRL